MNYPVLHTPSVCLWLYLYHISVHTPYYSVIWGLCVCTTFFRIM